MKRLKIPELIQAHSLPERDLIDEHNLFSFIHPDFPGERLIACRNPALATRRADSYRTLMKSLTTLTRNTCSVTTITGCGSRSP